LYIEANKNPVRIKDISEIMLNNKNRLQNLEIGKLKIMGVINVSPNSYYKNSIATDYESISSRAKELEEAGADIIDIGAMSTAPYLEDTTFQYLEKERLRTGIEAVRDSSTLPISIDTPRAKVAKLCIDMGVDIINDITGLKHDKNMARVVSDSKVQLIMGAYNWSDSRTRHGDIDETMRILKTSLDIAREYKIPNENQIVDPSIGFFRKEGKNDFFTGIEIMEWYERDLNIISNLAKLETHLRPICISVSNKSFLGQLFGLDIRNRLVPSLIFELLCFLRGATIIRTHNVKQTRIAINAVEYYLQK
jgi:dihydropteroate synthase